MSQPRTQGARDRAALEKQLHRDQLEKQRARIATLRANLVELRGGKRSRTKQLRAKVREDLQRIRSRTREMRAALRLASQAAAELARYIAPGARVHLSKAHRAALAELASEHAGLVAGVSTSLDDEQRDARIARAWSKGRAPKMRHAERRHESDDAVRAELDPMQARIFSRLVRAGKKFPAGKSGASRAETFLAYLHNHGAEVAQQQRLDEQLDEAELVALEREHRAELDGVPF